MSEHTISDYDYKESQMNIRNNHTTENASGKWKAVIIIAQSNDKNGQKYNLFTDHWG